MTTPTETDTALTESWIVENIYKVERIAWKYADMLKHSDIDDLVQEALAAMLIAFRERGDSIHSGGYLLQVARNAMIEYVRSGGDDLLGRFYKKGYNERPEDVKLFSLPLPGGDGKRVLSDVLEDKPAPKEPELERRSLRNALSRLNESHRVALSMRYGLPGYGQYNEPEAAKVLGVNQKTYNMRLVNGRKKLRSDATLAGAWKREQASKRNKANKRHCLVCKKHLRVKHQIAATSQTVFSVETFLCKVCNMTYELNGYGCAVKRSNAAIAPPDGKVELESVLQLNRSVIHG
jgi:RNA polymerase sigma factor (sigma-70 family)